MSDREASAAADGAAPAGPRAKVPVAASWAAGWGLLLGKPHRLIPQIWVPVVLLFLIQQSNALTLAARAGRIDRIYEIFGLETALYALIGASAYAVALGRAGRFTLARLEIGPAEFRYLIAKFVFWSILFALLLGAAVVGGKIAGVFKGLNQVISSASAAADDATWMRELTWLGYFALYGPATVAGLIFAWFSARFALVFPQACDEGRLAVFRAMTLTKRNSWRLAWLFVLLGVSIAALFGIVLSVIGIGASDLGIDFGKSAPATPALPAGAGEYTFGRNGGASAASVQSIPKWVPPLAIVLAGTIWQIVFAGALAHAYRAVKPETREG
jgi:hypothetical protein